MFPTLGRFLRSELEPWPEMSNTEVSFPLSSPSTALKTPWSFLENWKHKRRRLNAQLKQAKKL